MFKGSIFAAVLATGLIGAGCATNHPQDKEGDEVKMKLSDAPSAVRQTLATAAPGAKIDSVDKETNKGATIYEADAVIDGKPMEIKVAEDGKLISKALDKEEMGKGDKEKGEKEDETPVKLEELPAAVKATLTKEAGTGKIGDIDKEQKHGATVYEADVTVDGKEWEIQIKDDGQLLKKKLEEGDEEKK